MIPNPKYQRPSWETVKATIKKLESDTERIGYLERILTTDLQEAEILPEDYYGWSSGSEGYTLGPRAEYPALDEIPEDDLRFFQMETETWRQCVRLELEFWQRRASTELESSAGGVKGSKRKGTTQLPEVKPIQWKGYDTQLVYLFQRLQAEGFLTLDFQKEPWKLLQMHFINSKDEAPSNLGQAWYNLQNNKTGDKTGKPRGSEQLDKIIEDMKQIGSGS